MVALYRESHVNYPPLDGSLSLPELVEFNAQNNSDVIFFVYEKPDSNDLVSISNSDFHRACHRAAQAIRPDCAGVDKEVVALIGISDTLLYQTIFMGIIFAGLIPFPMSPRNSAAAVTNMMQKTRCCRLITTQHSLASLIDGVKAGFVSHDTQTSPLQIDEIPALKHLYPALAGGTPDENIIPHSLGLPWSKYEVLFYLHSSGSTGFPKPIPISNLTAIHWCITPCVLDHIDVPAPIRVGSASLPSFHTLGIYIQLLVPIATLSSVSIYPPTSLLDPLAAPVVPNSQNILSSVLKTKSNALVVVPAFLAQWAFSPSAVDVLKTLEYVAYAGGPLAPKMGNALVHAGVKLSCVYGATEFGINTYFFRNSVEQKLWEWVRFGPNSKIRWALQDDDTYECQVLTVPTHQVSVENLPDVKGYTTSDVFIKHPTIESLWKIVGRLDDVLVLSSGEKTVPAPMESIISANPHVNGTVIFGRGRNQVGILIEPRAGCEIDVDDEKDLAEFRNRVWPHIEEANNEAPAFSRIFKEMILVTRSEKPMLRAGKGTVTKKATIKLYEEEINAIYETVEGSARAGIDVPLPTSWTVEDVEAWLKVHATAVNAEKAVDPDVDLFAQGFDSLSATFLKNRIIGSLSSSSDRNVQVSASRIDQNIIFSNPSIHQLARSVINAVLQQNGTGAVDAKADIENMIERYSVGLGNSVAETNTALVNGCNQRNHAVALTGSTGGLGSYLLADLLQREDVSAIYAFNRPSKGASIQQRQENSFKDRGLDFTLLQSGKLMYVETDTSDDHLGLDKELYQKICTSVTIIIHNAWRLDFNLALSSFDSHIRGTRNLIDLALSSPHHPKPRFMFTSSISSAQSWDRAKGPFPEEVQYDAGVATGPGYGASKYVSERVLVNSKLPASSFRIGQISGGPPRGAWSTTNWLPIIVESSVSLGTLPEAKGFVSWIPPHAVSNAILDVAFAAEEPPIAVNLVHPRPVAWRTLIQPVADALVERKVTNYPLPLVPFSEWHDKLESSAKDLSKETMKRIPAIKLLDFMRFMARSDIATRASGEMSSEAGGVASFATAVAERVSPTMKELKSLSSADAAQWVDYWVAMEMFQ
ncbi:putative aminoadipate reductase [Suillus fuscotomentosus]|uniref:Aminoadipate reductase n=1 Tax=Suillus fuscotomentosus TaxID=1912939 RepID=A0AAD4EFD4_9AGAM|nr:putative aminoadipate reductase [Suillus fuscotomentosus]KAG1905243.1 putative aminoadipate reductase [Suillus fuscotomentosus]